MKAIALIFITLRFYTLAVLTLMLGIAYDFSKWLMRKAEKQERERKKKITMDDLESF